MKNTCSDPTRPNSANTGLDATSDANNAACTLGPINAHPTHKGPNGRLSHTAQSGIRASEQRGSSRDSVGFDPIHLCRLPREPMSNHRGVWLSTNLDGLLPGAQPAALLRTVSFGCVRQRLRGCGCRGNRIQLPGGWIRSFCATLAQKNMHLRWLASPLDLKG